jgi:hypothetical protein
MERPSKEVLDAALETAINAAQIYHGSGQAPANEQNRLYDSMVKRSIRVSNLTNRDELLVRNLISEEAYARGSIYYAKSAEK